MICLIVEHPESEFVIITKSRFHKKCSNNYFSGYFYVPIWIPVVDARKLLNIATRVYKKIS